MKRIKSACLYQTVCFDSDEEYEHFKKTLARKRTQYVEESALKSGDGSLTVKLKRQFNAYSMKDFV